MNNPKQFQRLLTEMFLFDDVNDTISLLSSDVHIKKRLKSIAYYPDKNKVYRNQVRKEFRLDQFDLVDHVERVWEFELEGGLTMEPPPESDLEVSLMGVYEISLAGAMHIISTYMGQGEPVYNFIYRNTSKKIKKSFSWNCYLLECFLTKYMKDIMICSRKEMGPYLF